ncbi:MAG: ATP-binding cassette domain-containing protein [Candidatus Abyssobacteria bacterium SURF_5]|uniref:ATP-binding cassette domain-containing protein n=1 Tax=Abyssobacteria bacterium (strain SURF_5) TaxID=2093360 RepID=A0A3A4N5H6_ABYX5|nr:MAG: ATP-binding cassette domain-containing protein [Candidatus Abyssubacteria bacterium SURF_5]
MIVFENVSKEYENGALAVDSLSLQVSAGEALVLLGTSGCGKTTTLKMVNRLIEPTRGRISIDGEDIRTQDPIRLRRRIGYAIQEIGLLPHMTVSENIAVVPKLLKWPKRRIEERVDELLRLVGLGAEEFHDRYPSQLSGGQRQRVGVARALAADPPIILMDEPFGALDPITREQLQNEFADLLANLKKTVIFVTHDIFEAVKIGERVALLHAGKLQQVDSPAALVEHPANEFVDSFLGRHRLVLSLLTATIKSIMPVTPGMVSEPDSVNPKEKLLASDSLLDALEVFKRTNQEALPVFEREAFVSYLKKEVLLRAVTQKAFHEAVT